MIPKPEDYLLSGISQEQIKDLISHSGIGTARYSGSMKTPFAEQSIIMANMTIYHYDGPAIHCRFELLNNEVVVSWSMATRATP